jgi:hypothetical protein
MSAGEVFRRELRVAFSRKAQPVWFRVLKWMIAVGVSFLLWGKPHFWLWILGALGLSLTVHFIWRWKTKGWTEPWGGWDDVESADKVRKPARGAAHSNT